MIVPVFHITNDEDLRIIIASLRNQIWELNVKPRLCPEHAKGSSLQVNFTPEKFDVTIETCCQPFKDELLERARVAVEVRNQFAPPQE
jgi:hypothetical protein